MNRFVRLALVASTLACTLSVAAPRAAGAQVSPADSAAVLLETAQEFAARGDHDVARALYRYLLQRWPDSSAARTAESRLAAAGSSDPGDGATELQVWSTLYGLFLGVAVPTALGADDSEAYGVGLLLGGPAGFVAGRKVARAQRYTVGQARAITLGGTWGLWQGLGWREVLDIGEDFRCDIDFCVSEGTAEETATAMILGSAAGLAVGAYLARDPISDGTATGANTGALWGSWAGLAVGKMFDVRDSDDLMLATLLGGNAGLAALAFTADDLGWSRSRWRVVTIASVLGALGGFGIDLIVQPNHDAVIFGIPLATSIVGTAVAIRATRDDPDAYERRGGAPAPDADAGSLLGWRDGTFSVGTPTPLPTLLPLDGPRGTEWKPALGVTLFRAVF